MRKSYQYRFMPPIRRTPPAQHSEFTCRLLPEERVASGFDVEKAIYDASTVVRFYSSLYTTPDESSSPFPQRSRPPLLIAAA